MNIERFRQETRVESPNSKRILLQRFVSEHSELIGFRQLLTSELSVLTQSNTTIKKIFFMVWSESNQAWRLLPQDSSGTLVIVDGNNLQMKNGGEYVMGETVEVFIRQ
jgi:hypothetical protein